MQDVAVVNDVDIVVGFGVLRGEDVALGVVNAVHVVVVVVVVVGAL